jgi:hypothetical protein
MDVTRPSITNQTTPKPTKVTHANDYPNTDELLRPREVAEILGVRTDDERPTGS